MRTEEAVLILAQWLSPGYPVGAFAYSHGLEGAADAGWVRDAAGLEDWLRTVLSDGSGRADAILLAAAYRAETADRLAEIDATARAFAASRERCLETAEQGAAFARVTDAVWGADLGALVYPVAVGRAAVVEGLPIGLTLRLYLQAFAGNLVAAGQRLLPVGQTEAQAILRRLHPLIDGIAAEAEPGDLEALSSTAFLSDIAAMRHETQYSRIFRT